jgi:hypothetical protein
MLDRWRLAIVLALFGFLASGALIVNGSMGNYSELETRWGWVINVACPAHLLMSQFFAGVNDGTSTMLRSLRRPPQTRRSGFAEARW